MKNLTIVTILLLAYASCTSDNEDPTTFRGEVVFPKGDERTAEQVQIRIVGYKNEGIGSRDDVVASATLRLNNISRFDTTFSSRDVDDYFLNVTILKDDGSGEWEQTLDGNALDCSPYDCSDLTPGRSYDLTIRVLE